jgi:hypothetical protein
MQRVGRAIGYCCQGAVIQVSGLAGQGIVAILEYGLAYLGGIGGFVGRTVKGTDAAISGPA